MVDSLYARTHRRSEARSQAAAAPLGHHTVARPGAHLHEVWLAVSALRHRPGLVLRVPVRRRRS